MMLLCISQLRAKLVGRLADEHPMLAQGLFHGTLIGETFQMPGMMD